MEPPFYHLKGETLSELSSAEVQRVRLHVFTGSQGNTALIKTTIIAHSFRLRRLYGK